MKWWTALRKMKAGNIIIVFAAVQIICIIAGLLFPQSFAYLSWANIQTLLKSIAPLAIMATGMGLLMIAGEFDLSAGSTFALCAYIMVMLCNTGIPMPAAILIALGLGAVIGLVNAIITLKAGIPSFIATLGGMMFWRGILLGVSHGQPQSFHPNPFIKGLFAGSLGPIQAQFLWAMGIAFMGYLLLERHKFGNHIYAVGGNRDSAIAIGVNPYSVKLICFVLVGVLAAFSGIISTARVPSVSPEQGTGMELQAIAACVIGGLSLTGGKGSVLGIFLGTSLLFTITSALLLMRVPGTYLNMFIGILIVVAVIFNRLTEKES
ncbi:MAG TPA: ABC transporter permease [Candidatus Hydrogenedentes bacterium]|nr:ABC transporter permease [Candidatus Hydrogenedentota bacterium]